MILFFIDPAAWSEVRDNANAEVDWVIVGYEAGSKVNVTTLAKGRGGVEACSARLPALTVVFGGCKLRRNGRFVTFFHVDDDAPALLKGTALLHKNGETLLPACQ